MATLAHTVASHVQTMFFSFSAMTNNNGKSNLATQDYTSLASSLANSYYVLYCSSSPLD